MRVHALEHMLLAVVLAWLGWFAFAAISASREQSALARELERIPPAAPANRVPVRALRTRPPLRSVIGRIDVPRLKLSAIAREGADARTLRSAVGHVPETALPGEAGNAAFAAPRDTMFGSLKDIRRGDEVIVTTANGVHRYTVTETRVVSAMQNWTLAPTPGESVTLVTSYPFEYIGAAPDRFIVRADAVATESR